jgi:hypothetical protein
MQWQRVEPTQKYNSAGYTAPSGFHYQYTTVQHWYEITMV